MTTDVTLNAIDLSTAVPDAKVLRPVRPLVGARRDVFVDVPGRAGSWRFTEEPGDRIIELELDITSSSFANLRSSVEALADWADVGAVAPLLVDDQSDRYYPDALLSDAPAVDDWLNSAAILLQFRTGPYALAVSTSSESVTANSNPDSDSFVAADEITAEPIIQLTPLDGTMTDFSLTLNGDALAFASQTITQGQTITISTISDTVTLGVNGDTMLTGAFTGTVIMGDVSGTFPLIIAGSNTWSLSWNGTATNVAVSFTWRRRFRR